MAYINQIQELDNNSNVTKTHTIGSVFSNIFYDSKDKDGNNKIWNYTLKQFFDTVQAFFIAPMHMIYQSAEPESFYIKEWYEITETN